MTERRLPKTAVENLVEDLASKANADLSNLDATGQAKLDAKANIALTNSPYTTNRILEIPQDIKLELNNGTLTLKAGSKVYEPNGFEADGTTPKFDVVVIENDIHAVGPLGSFTDKWIFGYRNNGFYWELLSHCFSGSTLPTQTGENRLGYNTTVNKIQRSENGGAYIDDICSFPICIFSTNSGIITSIDQVFNGFGYIGSTTFILPGVKWQRCAQSVNYGKNADGTNASVIRSTSSVLLVNHPNTVTSTHYICVSDGGGAARYTSRGSKIVYYDESKNAWYNDYSETYVYIIPLLEEHTTKGRVDSFTPFSVDSVVNSNASNFSQAGRSYLSGLGMPSSRYIDLTLGASGSTYTAPANGWFAANGSNSGGFGYLSLYRQSDFLGNSVTTTTTGSVPTKASIPSKKGDVVILAYGNGMSVSNFRFIYAEGEE